MDENKSSVSNLKNKTLISLLENRNDTLNVILKISILILIIQLIYQLSAVSNAFIHQGPSCSSNKSSFQLWMSKQNSKAKIVSIYEDRLQPTNGTTSCSGLYQIDNENSYKDWSGSISDTSVGVVGRVSL